MPIPLPTLLDLAAVGVKMIERGGVSHVVDWVGAEFYPNVADLLEEACRFGLSRRLSGSLDYARLTPSSRILLVHARAHVANSADFGPYPCPVERHRPDSPACAGVWWRDLNGGSPLDDPAEPLAVLRRLPSCTYRGRRRPEGVTPCYRPAFFASFPASRLVVVRGADGRHAGALARARRAGLPVVEVEA